MYIENREETGSDIIIYQCVGPNCKKKKGKLLENYIKKYRLQDKIKTDVMGCTDRCNAAPILHLHPDDIWFSERDLGTVFKKHILNK
ncbi:(2Fe-2S) ferredoxin domain-containing protein [Sediminibacterium soli]|uniref:(2Fe-2S) ferredoxin domain-containing protein n=1 Tax=Sediminibacterium soli TaxID=2698829 RepID=UPI001379A99C|nr:(2Fe-2S) ferredoxin domain-containing protein [Sediminibacterium soli]NCI46696.1 (2Fe-2S) ferredoxin domain-containing protein [Sediminibacterium soli]